MDDVAELSQQLADVTNERDALRAEMRAAPEDYPNLLRINREATAHVENLNNQLAQAIADAACKLGITSEGMALTGTHLLMLLDDMVTFATDG